MIKQENMSLCDDLKRQTKSLHKAAESTPFVRSLITGQTKLLSYTHYLQELYWIYQALEEKLNELTLLPCIKALAIPEVYRCTKIANDLSAFNQPLSPSKHTTTKAYVKAIQTITQNNHHKLIGHYYVRYLGDLSGGQIIKRILKKHYNMPDAQTSFYDFSELISLSPNGKLYLRDKISQCCACYPRSDYIDSAKEVFQLNVNLLKEAG